MPKTTKECIQTVEKQLGLAFGGFEAELSVCGEEICRNIPFEEKRDMVIRIREAAEAIEDLYEQLDDMRAEARMMEEVSE